MYIYKNIAFFFVFNFLTTNSTLFVKIWFIVFDHFSSIFAVQLKMLKLDTSELNFLRVENLQLPIL